MNTEKICEILKEHIPNLEILIDEPMSKHTSFKIGGNAQVFVLGKSVDDIKEIVFICNSNNIPLHIIGNGSNLLVRDEGIEGVVLKVCMDSVIIEKDSSIKQGDVVYVTVDAGMVLAKLAHILSNANIEGFEFAAGIPGTIGGAIRMNAGAFGLEMKDVVVQTIALNKNSDEIVTFSNEEQNFQYRNSIFKNKEYIILQAKLMLKYTENPSNIQDKMDEYKKFRLEKQPFEYASAGSTFKRGEDFITAKLIDECGLKGYTIGGAQVSTKHAGFVVNLGNATCTDVLNLAQHIKDVVFKKTGQIIELEIEVL